MPSKAPPAVFNGAQQGLHELTGGRLSGVSVGGVSGDRQYARLVVDRRQSLLHSTQLEMMFTNIVETNKINIIMYVTSKSWEVNNHNRYDFIHVGVKKETYVEVRGLVIGQSSARLHPLFSYAWFMAGAMNPAVKHFLFAFLLIARVMAIAINPVGNGIVVFLIYRSREGRGRTHRAAKRSCQ